MYSLATKNLSSWPDAETSKKFSDGTIDPALLQCASSLDLGDADWQESTPPEQLFGRYNAIDPALELTWYLPVTKEAGAAPIQRHQVAHGKNPHPAFSVITETSDLQRSSIAIRSHQDIAEFYKRCSHKEVYQLWLSAKDFAARVCKQIWDVWYHNYFELEWFDYIVSRKGWQQYSPSVGLSGLDKHIDIPDESRVPMGDENELAALLVELDNTTQAIMDLCQDSKRDYEIDPSQIAVRETVQDIDTSDSYDTDDGDDTRYREIRDCLTTFHNDNEKTLLRIGPVLESRMRKDIRAWARIARYACIRLPGDTILVHKQWVQRNRRHRKTLNTDLHGGGTLGEGNVMCRYCSRRFKSRNEAERHEEWRHTGLYMCECCPRKPKKFDTEHELRLHESEKQYACDYCSNRFRSKHEVERHQNILHLRRFSWSCAALFHIEAAFFASSMDNVDFCGYCGDEFPNGPDAPQWDVRAQHLNNVHKFKECNLAKKFYRADHFRQHLKHSHQSVPGKWTNMLEEACMKHELPPEKRDSPVAVTQAANLDLSIKTNFLSPLPPPPPPKVIDRFEQNSWNWGEDIWHPRDNYTGYASASSMSSASVASTDSRAKKRRLPRDEDGYACDFTGCDKTYDRHCDLRQHKRCHRSEDDLPCQCNICWKRFPFPKDLRRHMRKHGK